MKGVFTPNDGKLEVRQKCRVRLVKDELDRPRVRYPHFGDPSIRVRVATLELRIDDALKGGHHVFRIECAAVTEAQPVAQAHLELRGARGGHRLREVGDHLERARVNRHKRGEK